MKWRRTAVAVALVILGVALQTTLFVKLRPFGASPALALLVTLAVSRHLGRVPSLLVGFATGLLLDLLSETALGLWALVLTTVAFATVRLRRRFEDDVTPADPRGVPHLLRRRWHCTRSSVRSSGSRRWPTPRWCARCSCPRSTTRSWRRWSFPPITRLIGERGGGRPGWDP